MIAKYRDAPTFRVARVESSHGDISKMPAEDAYGC